MAVGVEYHGGLGGIGIENTMVGGVVVYWVVSERARRISTRAYVEKKRRCALVKGLFEILNAGVVSCCLSSNLLRSVGINDRSITATRAL